MKMLVILSITKFPHNYHVDTFFPGRWLPVFWGHFAYRFTGQHFVYFIALLFPSQYSV